MLQFFKMNEYNIKYLVLITVIKIVYCNEAEITVENMYEGLPSKERLDVFDSKDEETNYETIFINLPNSTESLDTEISFSFTVLGREIKLNLNKTNYFIVDSNTPVYNLTSAANDRLVCHEIALNINPLEGFYEDKNNSALLYISVDANGIKRVENGIIKAENLTIQRKSKYLILPDGNMTNVNKPNEYIIQNITNTSDNYAVLNDADISDKKIPLSTVPNELSINILLLVDSNFLNKSSGFNGGFNSSMEYLINFWSRVSMVFQNLIKPKYRIKIAGIAVDYDNQVFDFLIKHIPIEWGGLTKALEYNNAFGDINKWLQNKSLDCIPMESYSIAITHTPLLHDCFIRLNDSCVTFSKWGVIQESKACFVEHILHIPLLTKFKNIGLLFDDRFFNSIKVAANQIATMLGVFKNEESCHMLNNTVDMVSTIRPSQNKWTNCSLKSFKAFLQTNPTCLYGVPK